MANILKYIVENITFIVNRKTYNRYYLLVDDIYPKSAIFVQTKHEPLNMIDDEKGSNLKNLLPLEQPIVVRCYLYFQTYLQKPLEIKDLTTHYRLRNDIIQHL